MKEPSVSPNSRAEKRKVLFISFHYPPCASSGVFRAIRFIKHLPSFGWQPLVLTVSPATYGKDVPLDEDLARQSGLGGKGDVCYAPLLFQADRFMVWLRRLFPRKHAGNGDAEKGEEVVKTGAAPSPRRSFWARTKDALTMVLMTPDKQNSWLPSAFYYGWRVLRQENVALLYASGGPWTAFVTGLALKKVSGKPLVLDFRDPWTDNPYDAFDWGLRGWVNRYLEKKCVQGADLVVANTESLRRVLLEKYQGVGTCRFVTITNGYDESDFAGLQPSVDNRSRPETVRLMHIGSIYAQRSAEPLLSAISSLLAAGRIPPGGIEVCLVGASPDRAFYDFLETKGLAEMVRVKGRVAKKEALEALLSADILLIIQPRTGLQVPAKLFEYFRAGKPILGLCGEGATRELIVSHRRGEAADPADPQEVQEKFLALYKQVQEGRSRSGDRPAVDDDIRSFEGKALTGCLARCFEEIGKNDG